MASQSLASTHLTTDARFVLWLEPAVRREIDRHERVSERGVCKHCEQGGSLQPCVKKRILCEEAGADWHTHRQEKNSRLAAAASRALPQERPSASTPESSLTLSPGLDTSTPNLDTNSTPRHPMPTRPTRHPSTPLDTPRHPSTPSRLKPCSTVSRCQTRHLDTPRHPSTPLDTARHRSTPLDTARHL